MKIKEHSLIFERIIFNLPSDSDVASEDISTDFSESELSESSYWLMRSNSNLYSIRGIFKFLKSYNINLMTKFILKTYSFSFFKDLILLRDLSSSLVNFSYS